MVETENSAAGSLYQIQRNGVFALKNQYLKYVLLVFSTDSIIKAGVSFSKQDASTQMDDPLTLILA